MKKPDIEKRLSILLFKMKCDFIDANTNLPSHSELIEWLYVNVVERVIDPNSPVTKEAKMRVESSFNNLIDFANAASLKTASSYVVDYYWNAIRDKTDVYDKIKDPVDNIPTFEDVVEDFTKFCYSAR